MSKDRKSAHGTVLTASIAIFQFIAVIQIILLSLHVDVKERALVAAVEKNPRNGKMVGLIGLEPMTPALSRRCSNQLSYRPRLDC